MKSLLLKNKNQILILKIVLIVVSLVPIILDLINLSEIINNNSDELFIYLTKLYIIPIALFICTLLAEKKFLFILTLLTLNIVYFSNCLGFSSLYTYIVFAIDGNFFDIFVGQLIPFLHNGINTSSVLQLIWLIMIIVIFTMSIIILVKYSKNNYNKVPLKLLIPFITLCLLCECITYFYTYNLLPTYYILYTIIGIYLAFYPKKFKKNNTGKLSQDVSLTELNDLYIMGKISEEQYYYERQKIIDNI